MRLSLGVYLLVAALLVPAATAQTPSASPSVSVAIAASQAHVSVDHSVSIQVSVKNTMMPTNPTVDAQNTGDVAVVVSGVPDGWTASVSPAAFRLAPGEAKTVTLQVGVAATASASRADLTVTATISSPLERLDPVLGQVPGGTQTASASDKVSVLRQDSVTRSVLESIGPWIYAILLLLVAAVLVAVAISVASRRTLVRLSSESREMPIKPGGKVSFPFRIEGLAKQTDTVLLQVSAVQEGWAAFLPVPEMTLEPGQAEDLTLVVIAPKDVQPGARQAVLVTATSAKAPKGSANLEFVASVEGK